MSYTAVYLQFESSLSDGKLRCCKLKNGLSLRRERIEIIRSKRRWDGNDEWKRLLSFIRQLSPRETRRDRQESRLTSIHIDVSWHLTFTRVKNTNRTKQLLTRVRYSIDPVDPRFASSPLRNSPLCTIHAIFFQPSITERTEHSRIFVGDKFFEGTPRHE